MRFRVIAIVVCGVTATSLFAGYAARDSWFAVVAHATAFGGRGFYTTVYMTDTSGAMNDVTLSFFAAGQPNVPPRSITLQLGPNQSGAVDIGSQLAGDAGAIGALHIRATGPLVAEARVYSRLPNEPPGAEVGEVLNAIPARLAIGTGESTLLHVPAGARYKLYAVETNGFPLYFSVTAGGGAERRLYLSPHEQRSWDLAQLFPAAQIAVVKIMGLNGSGKIIAIGTSIAERSQDFSAYEMLLPAQPRHRLTWGEIVAYAAVALALAVAALYRMKRPATR